MPEQPQQPQQMSEEQMKELQEKVKNMSPEELKEFQKKQCIFCHIISGKVQSKKVTLSIDSSVYGRYKKHCEENAIMLSKKIEIFMKKELEEAEDES